MPQSLKYSPSASPNTYLYIFPTCRTSIYASESQETSLFWKLSSKSTAISPTFLVKVRAISLTHSETG